MTFPTLFLPAAPTGRRWWRLHLMSIPPAADLTPVAGDLQSPLHAVQPFQAAAASLLPHLHAAAAYPYAPAEYLELIYLFCLHVSS